MEQNKIKAGDILYEIAGKVFGRNSEIKQVKVHSVGNKYMYEDLYGKKGDGFTLDTLEHIDKEYSHRWRQLHRTKQEIYDKWEYDELRAVISETLKGHIKCNVTLEQLRQIMNIIKPEFDKVEKIC